MARRPPSGGRRKAMPAKKDGAEPKKRGKKAKDVAAEPVVVVEAPPELPEPAAISPEPVGTEPVGPYAPGVLVYSPLSHTPHVEVAGDHYALTPGVNNFTDPHVAAHIVLTYHAAGVRQLTGDPGRNSALKAEADAAHERFKARAAG